MLPIQSFSRCRSHQLVQFTAIIRVSLTKTIYAWHIHSIHISLHSSITTKVHFLEKTNGVRPNIPRNLHHKDSRQYPTPDLSLLAHRCVIFSQITPDSGPSQTKYLSRETCPKGLVSYLPISPLPSQNRPQPISQHREAPPAATPFPPPCPTKSVLTGL